MKKIIFLCMLTVMSSASIFAVPEPGASERILKLFHQVFPKIEKAVFCDLGDGYLVYYKSNDSSAGRVYYDRMGDMVKTLKYYGESELDPFIRGKIADKYNAKRIFGVTEMLSDEEHSYHIVLQDDKNWYNIVSDATGSMRMVSKLKKT
jgi:hypothetical protein